MSASSLGLVAVWGLVEPRSGLCSSPSGRWCWPWPGWPMRPSGAAIPAGESSLWRGTVVGDRAGRGPLIGSSDRDVSTRSLGTGFGRATRGRFRRRRQLAPRPFRTDQLRPGRSRFRRMQNKPVNPCGIASVRQPRRGPAARCRPRRRQRGLAVLSAAGESRRVGSDAISRGLLDGVHRIWPWLGGRSGWPASSC